MGSALAVGVGVVVVVVVGVVVGVFQMTKVEGSNAREVAEHIAQQVVDQISDLDHGSLDKLFRRIVNTTIDPLEDAERRGVVRGLRMAAEYLHEHGKNSGCAIAHEHWLKVEADKLEKETGG